MVHCKPHLYPRQETGGVARLGWPTDHLSSEHGKRGKEGGANRRLDSGPLSTKFEPLLLTRSSERSSETFRN